MNTLLLFANAFLITICLNSFQFENNEKEQCRELMKKTNAILRLVNSMRKIDMPAFEKLCLDTYLLALEAFPFMMVANTLHRIFGHASKKMRRMKNRGLVSTQIDWSFSTNQLQLF